jgi:hypothetical protein
MGIVSGHDCEHWRGLLALDALAALPATERVLLDAHLDRCTTCRHEHGELLRVANVLPLVDPDHLEEDRMPAHLEKIVLSRLAGDARRERRRRRVWVGAGAALGGAAAAVVLAVGILLASPTSAPGYTVALHGSPGVTARVRLTSEAWGTAMHLSESGQPGGQMMWVSMRTAEGASWEVGTYTTVAGRRSRRLGRHVLRVADFEDHGDLGGRCQGTHGPAQLYMTTPRPTTSSGSNPRRGPAQTTDEARRRTSRSCSRERIGAR